MRPKFPPLGNTACQVSPRRFRFFFILMEGIPQCKPFETNAAVDEFRVYRDSLRTFSLPMKFVKRGGGHIEMKVPLRM
jgi:hypothetical protein